MILVTGSCGLVGRHLCARLAASGRDVLEFDVRRSRAEDVRNVRALEGALDGVEGVIHLAAVSRVAWAERDPGWCQAVNVDALDALAQLCAKAPFPPWVIFASSREVYGRVTAMPVPESAAIRPMNVYGRSKAAGERILYAVRDRGVVANVCRLSNVFGCTQDHADRVVMAFAKAAALGGTMSVEGRRHMFDFTAVADVVDGLIRMIDATARGTLLPPIHFVSGRGTTLQSLAETLQGYALHRVEIVETPARDFDVDGFVGDPSRAWELLGWRTTTDLHQALQRLVVELASP